MSHASIAFTSDASGDQISQQTAVAAAPVIAFQPIYQIVTPGSPATFSVIASSQTPVTYQWQFNGTNISGATSDSLLINNVNSTNQGSYTVTVTNSVSSVTSTAAQLYIDSYGNGLPDSWETQYFGNINQAGNFNQTANGDYSGDGITNITKFLNGLNPTVQTPWVWIAASGDFNTASNWNYQRYRGPGSADTCFINSGTFTLSGVVTAGHVTINVPFTAPSYFYNLDVTGTWIFNGAFTLAIPLELFGKHIGPGIRAADLRTTLATYFQIV